jgi:2-keto-4-pentenoate hydratase/2-oxohepta-3-ene-1,7-dioic acid hydratase in catechol pathway
MRLLRVGPPGRETPAVLIDDDRALDASPLTEDLDAEFLAGGGADRLREAVAAGDLPELDLTGQRIGSPTARPGKVVCIGLNYVDHAEESGMALPDEPVVFFKASNTVVGPYDPVFLPVGGEKTDWEVELGVVIGDVARYLPDEEAANSVIAGYCISNDVSERAFQLERGGQWVKGKSCETFNPLGPWLVTPDELPDVARLGLTLDVNGERMQDGTTADMAFSVPHLVWYLSQFMVLEPGDLINTGTPAGVGLGLDPPRYLREGDVMELAITGLGHQRQVCERARRDR